MAPNRPRSNSNAYQNRGRSRSPHIAKQGHRSRGSNHASGLQQVVVARAGAQTSTPQNFAPRPVELGMSPASRYHHNLKVLRRHDPTIMSIFDQFSHVCVYHHDGSKWEKKGFEGSMFLFEREQEPKYGFFILNRAGMHDYIQSLRPTDEMNDANGFLNYRSNLPEGAQGTSKGEGSHKGELIGLWNHTTNVRDPLTTVMMRLFSFVKAGQPYPEEHRYGPDRRAPLNTTASEEDDSEEDTSDDSDEAIVVERNRQLRQRTQPEQKSAAVPGPSSRTVPSSNTQQAGLTELDKLFSRLDPPSQSSPASSLPSQQSAMSILDFLNGGGSKAAASLTSDIPEPTPSTGIPLLDSMFASVSVPAVPSAAPPQRPTAHSNGVTAASLMSQFQFPSHPSIAPSQARLSNGVPRNPEILSPQPSAAGLPQILTTGVLDDLMGAPENSSRSPSRNSASTSSQGHSATSAHGANNGYNYSPSSAGARRSKERGYIADRGEDDGGLSEASTGMESDVQDTAFLGTSQGRGNGLPHTLVSRSSFLSASSSGGGSGSLKGDATPRARSERLEPSSISSPASPPQLGPNLSRQRPPATNQTLSDQSVVTISGHVKKVANAGRGQLAQRASAPPSAVKTQFESSAELWPHAPSHSSSDSKIAEGSEATDGIDIVTLDFSEIGVLDDPRALEAKRNVSASKQPAKANKRKDEVVTNQSAMFTVQHANGKSRDVSSQRKGSEISSISIQDGKRSEVNPNGMSTITSSPSSNPSTVRASSSKPLISAPPVTTELVKGILLSETARSGLNAHESSVLDKNAFIREVLTLIHTDKSFVERLYQGYLHSSAQT